MVLRRRRTAKEKAFIDFYIESGSSTEAATKAGYSEATANVKGCYLKKKLATEIAERVAGNFRDKSPRMAKIIEDLAEKSTNDQVRYKAASDYLDRGGYKPAEKFEEIKPAKNPEDLIDQLRGMLPSLLNEIWPRLTDDEQAACLSAIGSNAGQRSTVTAPLKLVTV